MAKQAQLNDGREHLGGTAGRRGPMMYLLRLCRLRCRPSGKITYILIFLCSCLAPLYLLNHSYSKKSQVPHFIRHRYLAKVNGENETTGKLVDHAEFSHSHKISHDQHFSQYYLKSSSEQPALFKNWKKSTVSQCDGHFKGFGSLGALLHDVILDTSKCNGPKGGEKFEELMNQPEEIEFLKYSPGFLTLPCDEQRPSYKFNNGKKNHLDRWMDMLMAGSVENPDKIIDDFTIAITRYEYVNIYHTMTDYYNAFLVMAYFNKTQHETGILVLDAHPAGGLDSVWGTVFSSMTRISQLPKQTRFTNLAFGILGYSSPLYISSRNHGKTLPLAEEFREFFLTSYNLPVHRPLDCKKLSLLFIWRRDYVAHPRNPKGTVHRKIMNEDELIEKVKLAHPSFTVKGVQLDRFEMSEQVKFVAEADILIGMHGAALSHMLFMPEGRGLIELMPKYITPAWRGHFIKMAAEKGIIYTRWVNTDSAFEQSNYRTIVPVAVVNERISELMSKMCSN